MNQPRPITIFALALSTLLFASCAGKLPVSQWRSNEFQGSVDNILIIGVSSNADRRYTFENTFVEALKANNTTAFSSRPLLPSSINLRRDIVEKAIEGKNFGAVLLTRVSAVREKETYHLPTGYDYQRADDGYYDVALQETNKGYYASERLMILETLLYDTRSGDLVWTMHSPTSIEDKSEKEIIQQQIQLTIEKLKTSGLIRNQS